MVMLDLLLLGEAGSTCFGRFDPVVCAKPIVNIEYVSVGVIDVLMCAQLRVRWRRPLCYLPRSLTLHIRGQWNQG